MIVKQFQVSVDKVSCAHQIMLRLSLLIVTSFCCININGLPVSVSNSVPEIHWDWFFETFPLSTEQLNTVNYFLHWAVKYLNYISRVLMDITSNINLLLLSLISFLQENPSPSKQQIEDNFDGNICRCTGRILLCVEFLYILKINVLKNTFFLIEY